ncbi:MAG: hypothetical protein ACRD5B_01345 [Nitrososphaeraceae archaeon]
MNITKEKMLLVAAILGLSFVILSDFSIVKFSIAQQQEGNQAQNNTDMIQEPKFLKNSTSFGNATADLTIKHAPEFSALTIQPWPIVNPNQEFNISGTLVDRITLQPIPSSEITFLYESASESIPPFSLQEIGNQQTDSNGRFAMTSKAPQVNGTISITAVFDGSGLYHAGVSDPALVIVSNSTLPP